MKKIVICLLALLFTLPTTACFDDEKDCVQAISGTAVLAYWDTEVILTSKEPITGEDPAQFKPTISASDISLSGALQGKKVGSVTFVSADEVKVVLTGKSTAMTDSVDYGYITVSQNALENDYPCFANVIVKKAHLHTRNNVSYGHPTKTYVTTYTLDAGSFTLDATAQNVALTSDSDGQLVRVELNQSENTLTVEVTGATKMPKVTLNACVTTFNKQVTVNVGAGEVVME